MPKLLDIEEGDKELPLLAIFGENEPILQLLVDEFASKFRLIILSQKKPSFLEKDHKIYFLDFKSLALLPKLQETLDYALILLSDNSAKDQVEPLMAKVIIDKAKALFLVDVDVVNENLTLLKEYRDYQFSFFGILGEVISQKKLEGKGDLSKIIENAIAKGEIHLSGNEAFPVYGIMSNDFLIGVARLLFGNVSNEKCYFLFYNHPHTILETTHLIGRVDSEIKISFSETHKPPTVISRQNIEDIVKQTLRVDCSYIDTFFAGFEKGYLFLLEHRDILLQKTYSSNSGKKKSKIPVKKSHLSFVFSSLFFGGFIFIFMNTLFLGLCLLFFKNSIDSLKKNDFNRVTQNAHMSEMFLSFIKPSAALLFDALTLVDKNGVVEEKYFLLGRSIGLSSLAGDASAVFRERGIDLKTLNTTLANLSYLYQEGQRLIMETNNKTLREQLKPTYSKLLSFSSVLPYILGFDEERNYLLLFQNDEELRPTGGFIGSIGDLTIKKAKVENLVIQDVYELDGQLKNHVEPPFIVRRYLQPHLYLRDSNFYLNYQETASTAAFIYNLESGKQPNGVIAIDLRVLKEILKISGPVRLANYNITVTSDNVSDFIQSTIKDNFFPGSTQKKDVLNSVFNQLTLKLSTDPKFYLSIAKLLPDLLEQKDILISYSNNSIQKIFSANNYAGEYSFKPSPEPKTITDFLYINEANIGVNKVNSKISRKVAYEAMLEQGRVVSKARLLLTNTGKTDDYKVYVKFAVPSGSSLTQVLINNVKQNTTPAITDFKVYEAKNFKPLVGLETEQYTNGNLTYFAFIATAKLGQTTSIGIDYVNGAGKQLSTIANYSLTYIKQPGTLPYEVTTTFDYPEGYIPVDTQADSYGKNFLEEKNTIIHDFVTKLELQKATVQK